MIYHVSVIKLSKKKKHFPTYFEARITLISLNENDITRKKNHRPMCLMNINVAKVLEL